MNADERAPLSSITDSDIGREYFVHRISAEAARTLANHPRLRRVSAISRFAATAGLAALEGTNLPLERIALVFAISNGGVIYTRRFYAEIAKANTASPLLFPETVFNAPASHLAAILGLTGASYTVVGDGAVGVSALKLAEDLLHTIDIDACLVVGAEEIDPLVCEAYRRWHLLCHPPASKTGMTLSEGAGAVLLTRSEQEFRVSAIDHGTNYFRRSELPAKMRRVAANLACPPGVGSANGTFLDDAEEKAFGQVLYSPKKFLGESVGASVLWQLIAALQFLRNAAGLAEISAIATGVNQQLGGFSLAR